MNALYFDGQTLSLRTDMDRPKPPAGEALIRPTRMGICSTDMELTQGYMGFEGVLGHEFVGVVEAVADSKDQSWVGKRVVGTINCVCGQCDQCKAGIREHCRDRTVLGIQNRNGCFADFFTLPVQNLLEVPDTLDDDQAVFTEPVAAAMQVLRQITVINRPYITVLGDGRLGLLVSQVLSQLNATVRCVGKHPDKLKLCDKWGIKSRLLEDVGLRQDQDIVVDCTGSATGLPTAMAMLRPRGTLVLKTTVSPAHQQAIDWSPLVIHEINVVGSRCGPFDQALQTMAEGKVDVLGLIGRRMKLQDGVQAMKTAKQPGMLKVLLEP